jgi:predicted HTH transcriptional regulator
MNKEELKALVAPGEDSTRQFKADIANADSLAADLVAFSNSRGGTLLIGVAAMASSGPRPAAIVAASSRRRNSAGCSR